MLSTASALSSFFQLMRGLRGMSFALTLPGAAGTPAAPRRSLGKQPAGTTISESFIAFAHKSHRIHYKAEGGQGVER